MLRQRWSELAYFHWPYAPEDIQRLLPPGVTVDTCHGTAWVGLIPFEMQKVRISSLPVIPVLGNFIEINVRTYVTDSMGRRAVWFFSLDVPNPLIVAVARSVFALPYQWAKVTHEQEGNQHRYAMTRKQLRGDAPFADMAFTVGEPIIASEVSALEHFLSARWALLTHRRGKILYGRVHHERWPLHQVSEVRIDQSVVEAAGLPAPTGQPHSMYSPAVNVQVAWLEKFQYKQAHAHTPALGWQSG